MTNPDTRTNLTSFHCIYHTTTCGKQMHIHVDLIAQILEKV